MATEISLVKIQPYNRWETDSENICFQGFVKLRNFLGSRDCLHWR